MNKEEYIEVRDNTDGIEKLMAAVEDGEVECIEKLVNLGANIKARDKIGQTALKYSVKNRQARCIEILGKRGTNIEVRGNKWARQY